MKFIIQKECVLYVIMDKLVKMVNIVKKLNKKMKNVYFIMINHSVKNVKKITNLMKIIF